MVHPSRNPHPEKEKRHWSWAWHQDRGPSSSSSSSSEEEEEEEEEEEKGSREMKPLLENFEVGGKRSCDADDESVISTTPHHTLVTKDSESSPPYKKPCKDEAEKSLRESTFKSENNELKMMARKWEEGWAEQRFNTSGLSKCVGEKQELGSGSAGGLTDCRKLINNYMEMKQQPETDVTPRDSFERNNAMVISNMELWSDEIEKIREGMQEMENKFARILEMKNLFDEKNETQQQQSREKKPTLIQQRVLRMFNHNGKMKPSIKDTTFQLVTTSARPLCVTTCHALKCRERSCSGALVNIQNGLVC